MKLLLIMILNPDIHILMICIQKNSKNYLGKAERPNDPIQELHKDLAASLQKHLKK